MLEATKQKEETQENGEKVKALVSQEALSESIQKLGGWTKTLRPNATKSLEENIAAALEDHAQAVENSQGVISAMEAVNLCHGCVSAMSDNQCIGKVEEVSKKLEALAQQEAKKAKEIALDNSVAALQKSDCTQEDVSAFIEVSRASQGLFFSSWSKEAQGAGQVVM